MSTHLTVSVASTVSSTGTTASIPVTSTNVLTIPSSLLKLESLVTSKNVDPDDHLLHIYPMTIDDYTPWAIDEENGELRHQQMEYHAAIILYNFGIVQQCSGVMHGPSSNRNVTSLFKFKASYTIFSSTLSWISQLVDPLINHIMNGNQNDHPTEGFDPQDSSSNVTFTTNETASIPSTADPSDYNVSHIGKYLQIMILINYHILPMVDEMQLPNEYYEYHCTMIHEIWSWILYLEIFYPVATDNLNRINSNDQYVNGTNASPAA